MADDKSLGADVSGLIEDTLMRFLSTPTEIEAALAPKLPHDVMTQLATVLITKQGRSYRDAAIIQFAYGLTRPGLDLTQRHPSGRGVAQTLGRLFRANHIEANNDAFENIGKNQPNLCRNNEPAFDALLVWSTAASTADVRSAFMFLMASRAATARPVSPFPVIDRSKLTFAAVAGLFDELLHIPSGGAHEQFAVASCVDAIIDEFGQGGTNGLQVRTKNINASDASAGTAADVQIVRGNKTEEAFEVTANDWRQKIEPARRVIRDNDLPRIHVAATTSGAYLADLKTLAPDVDISILDVKAFVSTLVALMRKPARETALRRMWEMLDRHQSDVERVNAYVRLLHQHGLTRAD